MPNGAAHVGFMTPRRHRTDHELEQEITDELNWTPTVTADRIGVSLSHGAVTLSGQVETFPEKDAAVRAAMRVRGVTAVADEITVLHSWSIPDDTMIARDAIDAFERSVVVPSGAVQVRVSDHWVTLSGTVEWNYQRQAAHDAVAGLSGVSGVRNLIELKPSVVVSPAEAKAKITTALGRNAQMDADRVRVAVSGTEVRLTGSVSSWAERRQAESAAWFAPGVTEVHNHIDVTS